MSRPTVLVAALSALALSMIWVSPVFGTKPDPLHKVTICHRTASQTNPYVVITVDEASVDGDSGNDNGKGDHLLEHTGAVWAGPDSPPKWGDIIPPFYSNGETPTGLPGLNWPAGQAIFNNDCNPAEEQSQSEEDPQSEEEQSQSEEESESGEQSVAAGTGTPAESYPDTAMEIGGSNPLPTVGFSLILLASLAGLAFANVKEARSRS